MRSKLQMLAMTLAGLFVFHGRVDRKSYFLVGIILMILKYTVEASVIYMATGLGYSPLDFINPDRLDCPSNPPAGAHAYSKHF